MSRTLEGDRKSGAGGRGLAGRKFYAIVGGADGFIGVVRSSQQARQLTSGVTGARLRSCENEKEAHRFVDFYLRRAGAGKVSLKDLTAAAEAPIWIGEQKAVGAAEEAKEGAERFGQQFWEQVQDRADEQGKAPEEVLEAICTEYIIRVEQDFATYYEVARIVGVRLDLQ